MDITVVRAVTNTIGSLARSSPYDRIGRALDEIYPHLTDAWADLVLRGAQACGVAIDQLPGDVTRLAFEGAYVPGPGEVAPVKITYG